MNGLWQDVGVGARRLSTRPGFLIVALLSLGLGIGANTAIFSLINAVMLRILPVSHPEQLVMLTNPGESGVAVESREHGTRNILSYPEFEQLRQHNTVFSGMFAAQSAVSDLDVHTGQGGGERSSKAHVQLLSGEFFDFLGLQPVLGRAVTPQEARAQGANPVGVISYGFWQREFSSNASAIGRTIRVGQSTFQILGVPPAWVAGVVGGARSGIWSSNP